jgi:MbtH protein
MYRDEQEDASTYKVVVNHEEQYSIYSIDRENPLGWTSTGQTGTKAECLDYIKEVWTDMRPLSLRLRSMDEMFSRPSMSGDEQSVGLEGVSDCAAS